MKKATEIFINCKSVRAYLNGYGEKKVESEERKQRYTFELRFRNFRTNWTSSESFHYYAAHPDDDDTSKELALNKFVGIYYHGNHLADDSSVTLFCDGERLGRVINRIRTGKTVECFG